MNIKDILIAKGSNVFTVKPSSTIAALSEVLQANRIGAAVVARQSTESYPSAILPTPYIFTVKSCTPARYRI